MLSPICAVAHPDYTLSADYQLLDALDDDELLAHPDCGRTTAELVLMEPIGRALDALAVLD